jgi:GNAT superfamily N-acetyltransferase
MSLLREAALEARRLYRRIDVGVPLRQFIDSNAPIPTNPPLPPRGAYFIAFLGNDLVGSGALRPLDETTVEVRRMYVIRSARRAVVGGALLAHLGRTAADLGFRVMRLETGNRQLPAMALYESYGFVRIPPFGDYVNDPTSVCYEKRICPD